MHLKATEKAQVGKKYTIDAVEKENLDPRAVFEDNRNTSPSPKVPKPTQKQSKNSIKKVILPKRSQVQVHSMVRKPFTHTTNHTHDEESEPSDGLKHVKNMINSKRSIFIAEDDLDDSISNKQSTNDDIKEDIKQFNIKDLNKIIEIANSDTKSIIAISSIHSTPNAKAKLEQQYPKAQIHTPVHTSTYRPAIRPTHAHDTYHHHRGMI